MIRLKAKVLITTLVVQFTKVAGSRTSNMAMERKIGQMAALIKAIITLVSKKAQVLSSGLMVLGTMEHGKTTRCKVRVSSNGRMDVFI